MKTRNEPSGNNRQNHGLKGSNRVKDPDEWTTGDEPMTGAQKSYLETLSAGTGQKIDDQMTKAEAAQKIEEFHRQGRPEQAASGTGNAIKDPDAWKTGDEQMTGAQKSYLKTLSDEAGEEMDENLTKAEASRRIDELQRKTGRGRS